MSRIHRGYLTAALVLTVLAFVISLWLFPAWGQSLRLIASLAVAAVVGAFGFLAAWRQAVEKSDSKPAPPAIAQTQRSGVQVGGSTVSGDVVGQDKVEGDKVEGDKVAGDKIINVLPPITPTSALYQLPPPLPDFTGRVAELKDLREKMTPGGVTLSGVHGLGGIGKTALALKLAAELAPRYPDAQFYVDLRGVSERPLSPAEALSYIVRAYHPERRLPESAAELRGLYLSVLHGQKALVLMDNAKDAEQVRPLIPPEGCLLLVTSRQRFTLPGLYARNLDTMEPEEARELLVKIAPRLTDPHPSTAGRERAPRPSAQDATSGGTPLGRPSAQGATTVADEIAALCGYLPLALRAAGSLLAVTPDLAPEEYVAQLRDERGRLERIGAEGVEVSVEASLNLSYARLPAETARVFRMLAVFPASFEAMAEEAVCEDAEHQHLSELVKRSLVRFDDVSRRYSLHDLARLFAKKRLSEEESGEAQKRHARHYERVLRAARELYEQGGDSIPRGLALFDLEWVNIQAGQAWAAGNAEMDDTTAQLCNSYPDAGSYCLNLRLHSRDWIRWLEAALAAARRLKRRDAEGVHLGNLGLAYAALGETRRAIEFYEQRLQIARDAKHGDRRGEGNALGNLGNAYAALGETRRAIEFFEQCLKLHREIGDRRGEGADLGNLGLAYADLGETRRAIEFYEQHLQIAREIGDRRGEGNALGNLGLAYADLGETRRAIEFYEGALAIAREIGDWRGEGNALGNLGVAYRNLGETRRAIEFYEQCLKLHREIGDRRGEGADLGNLGTAYADLGETRRAIEFYEQQLKIVREIGDRRGEGNALFNMSLALDELGKRQKAVPLAEAALRIYEQIEDPREAKVRKRLAEWRGEGAGGEHGSSE